LAGCRREGRGLRGRGAAASRDWQLYWGGDGLKLEATLEGSCLPSKVEKHRYHPKGSSQVCPPLPFTHSSIIQQEGRKQVIPLPLGINLQGRQARPRSVVCRRASWKKAHPDPKLKPELLDSSLTLFSHPLYIHDPSGKSCLLGPPLMLPQIQSFSTSMAVVLPSHCSAHPHSSQVPHISLSDLDSCLPSSLGPSHMEYVPNIWAVLLLRAYSLCLEHSS
jgi:hypothetical protein